MDIKLIISDLDGTLVGHDLVLSPRVRQAVRRAQERGILVTVATGRGYPSAVGFCRQLGIAIPLICYQGAQIRAVDGRLCHQATLPRHFLPEVIAFCQDRGCELAVYARDEVYQSTQMYEASFYDRWFSLPHHLVDDLCAELPADPVKFIAISPDRARADCIQREMRHLAADRFQVMRSHALFVEGLRAGVSKGDAAARFVAQLGISRENVMAIGDSGNDAALVEWAGLGVAMGNATPDVKAVAQVVAPCQAEDGAAWAIERLALGGEALWR
jgi:Cof subfamily protein (haloacid dehalogenase superfamily)